MNKPLLLLIIVCQISTTAFPQEATTLADFNISNYYSQEEAQNNAFEKSEKEAILISTSDINQTFSNIDDLNWLKDIAVNSKVVLVGETHYSRYIGYLKSRIFFALNTYGYYPLIVIEQSYSQTQYVNHFIHLKEDKAAAEFFNAELNQLVGTKEDSIFFEHLRQWNKEHDDKPVTIGGADLEFSYDVMLERILKPYFYGLKGIDKLKVDSVMALKQSNEFFVEVKPLLEVAKEQKLIGKYPFITTSYISNVILNFESTNNALQLEFGYYRQKSIIRNLTDERFFGSYLNNNKVMLYGGGSHTKTHFQFPDGGNFLSEGSYLTYDYAPTKGKTHSIMLEGMAFILDKMSGRDLNECIGQGMQYKKIVTRMKKAFDKGLLKEDKPYFIFYDRNDFEKLIIEQAYQHNGSAVMLTDKSWASITTTSKTLVGDLAKAVRAVKEKKDLYDSYVFVPYSPLVVARKK